MAASEIDDIFAYKGKGKSAVQPLPTPSNSSKKKKKNKKTRISPPQEEPVQICNPKKRSAPETHAFVDPSQNKRPKVEKTKNTMQQFKTKAEADDTFHDSRGTGPRRKTDEGWSIFKEDELGIGDSGGDTPLCPFDCDCCF